MEDIQIIITIVSTVVVITGTFLALIWKMFKHFDDKFDRNFNDIKKNYQIIKINN